MISGSYGIDNGQEFTDTAANPGVAVRCAVALAAFVVGAADFDPTTADDALHSSPLAWQRRWRRIVAGRKHQRRDSDEGASLPKGLYGPDRLRPTLAPCSGAGVGE